MYKHRFERELQCRDVGLWVNLTLWGCMKYVEKGNGKREWGNFGGGEGKRPRNWRGEMERKE